MGVSNKLTLLIALRIIDKLIMLVMLVLLK